MKKLNHENKLKVKQAFTQLIMPYVDFAKYRMAFSELGFELGVLISYLKLGTCHREKLKIICCFFLLVLIKITNFDGRN